MLVIGLVCNLLALIPGAPATIKDNMLAFIGNVAPGGGWGAFLDLTNQFVRSGRADTLSQSRCRGGAGRFFAISTNASASLTRR